MLFSHPIEGYLVDTRAYQTFTLVGPPVLRPVQDPLAAFTSTTVYIIYVVFLLPNLVLFSQRGVTPFLER